MFRVQRRGGTRLSAVLAASSLAAITAIAAAAPAQAEDNPGGATAVLGGLVKSGKAVIHKDGGEDQKLSAGLFSLSGANGGELTTYCIDIFNPTQAKAEYRETPWDESSLHDNENAGKILWILQNSYPQKSDLAQLSKDAGIDGTISEDEAAAGTQVAIWRFSDNVNVEADDAKAEKLADYLETNAKALEEPKPSLSLSPSAVSGKAGEKLGPIKVATSAGQVNVALNPGAPAGVKVVNKDGQAMSTAKDGEDLYVDVPADAEAGEAGLTVKGSTVIPIGRVFTGFGKSEGSQTQILAGSSEASVEAGASVTWTGADTSGPAPAISTKNNCAEGGVDITVANEGDKEFVFELAGKKYEIGAGKTETVLFPVEEDQAYEIKIAMPDGSEKVFTGMLDCKTDSTNGGATGGSEPSNAPSPASVGGSEGTDTTGTSGSTGNTEGDLAETGSSSSTPVIAGVAVALLVVGGATVFFVRRRKAGTPAA
ncbi:peptidase [Wenjunlia vitaminophila]|uniref:Peptidase n=1 Tax=Wenjunlia vitaminophila TaxID=76728 RepID=A0A0T6LPB8_WENVI|nr:thioester domain-containing protein [Wenjunlia vitaminophila]KRV47888.1 peptidase [Wenjunlia vitaminophila]